MFAEDAAGPLPPTEGVVTVELRDADTGRVTHRDTADNFLSLQTLKVSRWWQRMIWGMYNPVETRDAAGALPTEMPWFPGQHVAYWNDATAESSSTEDAITKDLIGWASRHPIGSPSGKRGVVNITESEFKDAYSKWVFDWTTSQGNGTFQSIGWTRVDERTGMLIPRFPDDDLLPIATTNAGVAAGNTIAPVWWDGTVWNSVDYVSASTWRLLSYPAAGGGLTVVTAAIPGWSTSANSGIFGVARIGTDIITAGYTGSGPNRPELNRCTAAGASTWAKSEAALSGFWRDCTVDASNNIWTVSNIDTTVRRHSSTDGSITATVTPALAGVTAVQAIAFDPADGNLWVLGTINSVAAQLWKMDTAGNTVGPLLSIATVAQSVTSTAPYATQYTVPAASARDPFLFQLFTPTVNATAGNYVTRTPTLSATGSFLAMAMKGTDPHLSSGTTNGITNIRGTHAAGTLGTRSRLGAAVTKTSSQTMKITYQFNF